MTLSRDIIRLASTLLIALPALAFAPALRAQSQPSASLLANGPIDEPLEMPGLDEEQGPLLMGSMENGVYIPPSGAYRLPVPVLPELGGFIDDTENVATFQDEYGTHISIGCFPMVGALRAELATRGRKEFLAWFFQNHIRTDFQRTIPGTSVEPEARFIAGTHDGALFAQLLLPNGSVFSQRVFVFPPKPRPVAKRGNLLFVKNDFVYVISIELADRIFNHSTYSKTPAEENEILRTKIYELLDTFVFTPPAKPAPAAAAPAPRPAPAPAPANTGSAPSVMFPPPPASPAAPASGTAK